MTKIYHEAFFIEQFLLDEDVIEISFNPNKRLFVEYRSGIKEVEFDSDSHAVHNFLCAIADENDLIINHDHPIMSAIFTLQIGGGEKLQYRIEAQLPPVVAAPTFSIRKFSKLVFDLESYVETGVMSTAQYDVIIQAVKDHKNIVIVGGTSSGKTTLTNAIIKKISAVTPQDRLLILEDTGEIMSEHPNSVCLMTSFHVTMTDLVKSTMRMSPDRIIVGELRGGEALDLVEAWNTGHAGGVTTTHADSNRLGLARIESLVLQKSKNLPKDGISEAINILINIQKVAGKRKIVEILECKGLDEKGEYILREIS